MLNRISRIDERFREIDVLLASPEILRDQARYTELLRERKQLTPLIEAFQAYSDKTRELSELHSAIANEKDDELRSLMEEEAEIIDGSLRMLYDEMQACLLVSDPADSRNVIVEIRAGAGGEEAALFAADLYRMYTMYADKKGFSIEVLESGETELGGFRIISFLVKGSGAYSCFKYESGVHRVQRVPETESQGRIQTSTVTVAILPEVEEVEVSIPPQDIKIESCKSSGAGGQHINKTESAVRLTHLPTGIVIECQQERSQFKNKDKAMKLLYAKLYEMKEREQSGSIASERRSQVGTGDRSEKIRTYNFPQSRITDHRIGLTIYKLEAFLNGDLEDVIQALRTDENAKKLHAEQN